MPSWPLALGVFVSAYIIMYFGYLFDDRVRDSVVLLAQALGIAIVAVMLARALVQNRDQVQPAASRDDSDDEREGPFLAPRVINDAPPHRLDLRGLTINLLEMMALSERYDRDLTLLMISVDNADQLAEELGPKGVTRVKQEVGEILSETLRIPDRSGLYDDNQYLVILPETDVKSGQQTAERIRRQVVDTEIRIDARRRTSTTVSIGVAAFKQGDDPQGLLSRVQSALQEAQELGKNRSVQWTA